MAREVFTVLEVELVLPAFLGGACREVTVLGGVPQDGGEAQPLEEKR